MAHNDARKVNNPLEHTARLLDLVPYINTHQGISLADLANVFEVSMDQMVSDLRTLWMCGLPGYTPLELMDFDFESGYVTIRNAPTLARPRTITHEEGVALVLGLDLLRSTIAHDRTDLIDAISSLSHQIAGLINLPQALSATSNFRPQITSLIADAISQRGGLKISYHSLYKDEISSRVILPLELIESQGYLYLHGYCYSAHDFRHFRVDRIQSAESAEVERPSSAPSHTPEKIDFELKVVRATRDVAERFEQSDLKAGSILKSSSFSQHWIIRTVMAVGGSVELLSPSEIRNELAERAHSILSRYKR